MSYLGKISAIVSANTGDFSAKLAASGKEVASWARSLNSAVNSASSKASSSLRGIYTEAQRAERALQAIQAGKINFKGFEGQNLSAAVSRMQALISATKGVNEPLNQAARSLEKLPIAMQGGFIEAMKRAQTQAERLAFEIDKIGDGKLISGSALEQKFQAIANRAQATAEAVSRLKEAASAVGGLATGKELQFRNPEFAGEIARARRSQESAAATPGGNFSGIIERQRAAAEAMAAAFAKMEEAQLSIGGDVAGTTAAYERQLAATRAINAELERSVAATRERNSAPSGFVDIGYVRSSAVAARQLQQAAVEIGVALEDVQRSARRAAQVQAEARFDLAESLPFIDIGTVRARAVDAGQSQRAAIESLPFFSSDSLRQSAAGLPALGNPGGPFGPGLPSGFGGDSLAGLGAAIGDSSRQIDALRSGLVGVKSQLDQLPAGIRNQFIPALQLAEQEFRRLAATPDATAAAIARAEARLQSLQRSAQRAGESQTFSQNFGGAGARGLNFGIDQRSLRGIGAEVEFLQGRLARFSEQARGPAVQALQRFRQAASRLFDSGGISTEAGRRQLEAYRQEVVRTTAALLNIRPGRLAEQLRRVGDVARGSFGNVGLAIQQGIFAFDDFFSVTGGLDQRIRAAGNNISQLGFILGGTAGLITGVVVSAVAQLAVGILRWTGVTADAEDQQNRLKLALESTNNALERQRGIAQSLSDAYRDMARSIRESGLSDQGREELRRQQPMEEIKRKQAEQRLAAIEANDPAVGRENAAIANIDERLRTEENAAARRRLLRQREAAEERRRAAIETIETRGRQNAGAALGMGGGFDAAIRQQEEARERVRRERGRATGPEADRLTRELAVIDNTLQRLRAAAQNVGFAGADRAAQAFGRAQQNLSGIPGATFSDLVSRMSQARTESAQSRFREGRINFNELQRIVSQEEEFARATDQASIALKAFTEVMENAAGSLAKTVEQEATQAAEQARRQANAAEAEFGPADPRARFARNAQKELEAEQRRVAEERAKIDEEMVKQRESFERDAFNGVGDPRAVAIARRMQEIDTALANPPTSQQEVSDQNRMRAERERLAQEQRQIFESRPEVQAAARRADELDIQNQQLAQRQRTEKERADRGRDLGLPPGAKEAKEAGEALRDIAAARNRGDFGMAEANVRARREAQDQMRSAAPAIFEMADAVQNAILQGPSRQALNVSDVSTMEGSKELNRLLRGDDASKNQNLVELQKQNQSLTQMVTTLRDVADKMGIVLDIR